MAYVDEGLGLGWVAIAAVGFMIGFVLAKINVLRNENAATFCTWASTVPAGAIALFASASADSMLINMLGRLAIFAILWFVFGIVFTIGVAMGIEKAK